MTPVALMTGRKDEAFRALSRAAVSRSRACATSAGGASPAATRALSASAAARSASTSIADPVSASMARRAGRRRNCSIEGISRMCRPAPGRHAILWPFVMSENDPPSVPVPDYRPVERFWPYVDLPEQPTEEELARLNPELAEALFGRSPLPFSISIEFPTFDGGDYARALELARGSAEYLEVPTRRAPRHRARFFPQDAAGLRDL